MKREGSLILEVADPENLRLSFWKASRAKRGNHDVSAYREALDANLRRLREEILAGSAAIGRRTLRVAPLRSITQEIQRAEARGALRRDAPYLAEEFTEVGRPVPVAPRKHEKPCFRCRSLNVGSSTLDVGRYAERCQERPTSNAQRPTSNGTNGTKQAGPSPGRRASMRKPAFVAFR